MLVAGGPLPYGEQHISCSGDGCTAISLDASSTLNRFRNLIVNADGSGSVAVSDIGTGNCGNKITYVNGTGTFAPCP